MGRVQSNFSETPFAVRLRMLRRSRRRSTIQRMTDNVLWVAVFAVVGIIVATELIVALGRA